MDMAEGRSRLERDGYVILERRLSADFVKALLAALAPYEATKPMGRNNFEGERSQRVYSLAGKGAVFLELAEQPDVVALVDARLSPNWLLSTLQSIRLHPGETEQPWHTDDAFYDVPRPRTKPLGISVIWALEDFTADNGATELVPGSHRWGPEHPDDRPHDVVRAVMPSGSALVFDGGLWHRGGANHSAGTRLCISPQYCQPWLRPQESQLLIVPPAAAVAASPRGRAMLGYSIHPPFIGQVDGRHPLRLVDPSYSGRERPESRIADRVLERPTSTITGVETREGITVRFVRRADVPAVVALVRETLAEFGLRFGEGSATDEELTRLPESYDDGGGAFWVAVDENGRVLGTCGVVPVAPGDLELRKMYLHPDARGRGVGKRLLDESIAWSRAHGAARIVLDTTEQMTRAIAFYEANGFVRDDTQRRGSRCSRGYARAL